MTWLKVAALVIGMIVVGVFVRYGSGHPSDWLVHDMASKSGMPKLVIERVILPSFAATTRHRASASPAGSICT